MFVKNRYMKYRNIFSVLIAAFFAAGCAESTQTGSEVQADPDPDPQVEAVEYESLYDPISDEGQYYMPVSKKVPAAHWTIVDVAKRGDRNNLEIGDPNYGLQYHLLAQSIAGLVNRALDEGKVDFGVWLETDGVAYSKSKSYLGAEIGRQTAVELALGTYGPYEGIDVDVKSLADGYVLTDVTSNPESNEVATVAAHVYNSIIVDVRDKAKYEAAGYKMTYDARSKTTRDAWTEFKNKCSNKALVVMPVQTGELREFAIRNRLFCFNLNKLSGTSSGGQNTSLFDEILKWLEPNAPVLGWESGVGEDVFVGKVSQWGKLMLAADWSYNHSLTSVNYPERQTQVLSKVVNPRNIDYDKQSCFVSFFLSDGDNYQWVMGDGFVDNYYNLLASNNSAKMSYGLCGEALCQLCPARFEHIFSYQRKSGTIMETFGGGYFYVDTYSTLTGTRDDNLKIIAQRAAAHMRQHRIKVLHLMAKDWDCPKAQEAYQAFIDANDQLEGIVAIQYDPYTGGHGNVLWFTNSQGYDIPVISAKYGLWDGNTNAVNGTGRPSEVAGFISKAESAPSWSAVVVHAWSTFDGKRSADAAAACLEACPETVEPVNIQELIWRIRMAKRPEQTKKFLETIK